ncbi:MAG: NAD(P)H-hydrate epimerase, partial [Bacteroidota bacterium]
MYKILSAQQTRELDQYTIKNEPIASIDLMERASKAFTVAFCSLFPSSEQKVIVLCGVGNNGGDGFAIARILEERQYEIAVIHALVSEQLSIDCQKNKERLSADIEVIELREGDTFPIIQDDAILVDSFFGSGLNRPVEGYWGKLIQHINLSQATKIAVDIPSGLFADRVSSGNIIHANHTISFQLPKLAFFLAENDLHIGKWNIVDIGLSQKGIVQTASSTYQIDDTSISRLLKKRGKHDHKGTFGHALLIAGSYGKMGAAILSAKAILRVGAGLASVYVPKCGYQIMQISLPEAMVLTDRNEYLISQIPDGFTYKAIGIGPGLGTDPLTVQAVEDLLKKAEKPLVIDADALNIIAKQSDFFKIIPKNSILTPHP